MKENEFNSSHWFTSTLSLLLLDVSGQTNERLEMASVFLYHVVGDLTVGKPEMVEFLDTETVESAIRAIGESTEGGIAVWKRRSQQASVFENGEMRQQRFVGILNSLDIVAFLARSECLEDRDKAMKTPVSQVVLPNNFLLRQVDPGTRLAIYAIYACFSYDF